MKENNLASTRDCAYIYKSVKTIQNESKLHSHSLIKHQQQVIKHLES